MGRPILLLSVTLTIFSALPAFSQWGGYGTSYAQSMARRAARYGQRAVSRHANRMMNRQKAPKRQKLKKQNKQKQPESSEQNNQLPAQQSTGNMSPSSDYPEWPPPAEQSRNTPERALPSNPSGF